MQTLLAGNFYDDVMRELIFCLGAALFFGNALALWKRRADAEAASERTVANSRPGSPVRGYGRPAPEDGESRDLVQAPVARTVTYMLIGLIVMIAGLGAILNK